MGRGFCFEDVIEKFRYIIYLPIFSLLMTAVFILVWSLQGYRGWLEIHTITGKEILIGFVSYFELFLLAIMSIVFAVSLYEIYIKKPERNSKLPASLKITTLEEMKSKLGKMIYLILLVVFFQLVLQFNYDTAQELLMLAASILLVALSLHFTRSK